MSICIVCAVQDMGADVLIVVFLVCEPFKLYWRFIGENILFFLWETGLSLDKDSLDVSNGF